MTQEFIEVLHAIEMTIQREVVLGKYFQQVKTSPLFTRAELTLS